jgi:hypothetical protein
VRAAAHMFTLLLRSLWAGVALMTCQVAVPDAAPVCGLQTSWRGGSRWLVARPRASCDDGHDAVVHVACVDATGQRAAELAACG